MSMERRLWVRESLSFQRRKSTARTNDLEALSKQDPDRVPLTTAILLQVGLAAILAILLTAVALIAVVNAEECSFWHDSFYRPLSLLVMLPDQFFVPVIVFLFTRLFPHLC